MLTEFNKSESSVTVDMTCLCRPVSPLPEEAAIDRFYGSRDQVIQWGYQEPFTSRLELRANLLLIVFAAAESYFRRIFAETLALCPFAAESAAQQVVPLGAINSLGMNNVGLAISDTKGLTTSGEILQRTRALLGFNVAKTSSLGVAIEEFEKFCHLRHCIVHSSGELLYNNRRELKIKEPGRLRVNLDDKTFQDVVQIVVNVVRAYNNFIANEILQRWFASGYFCGQWPKDKRVFNPFHSLFVSSKDYATTRSSYEMYKAARTTMRKKTNN